MYNNWKKIAAGLLAVTMMIPLAAVPAYADNETEEAAADAAAETGTEEGAEEEESKRRTEPVEEIEITAADVKKYMTKLNSCEGITFYLRPEEYKDEIADEDVVDLLKKIELAGIDDKTGEVVCTLEEEDDTKEFVIFLSKEGRWLVYTDPEYKKVTMVRKIVSLLDNEFTFLSMDNKTLEVYNDDFDEVVRSLKQDGAVKDGEVHYTDDEKVWDYVLNKDFTQIKSAVRFVTENDNLALYVNDDNGIIAVKDKKSDYMWWSSPVGSGHDPIATGTIVSDLQSSVNIVYGEPAKRATTNMRSGSDASVKVKDKGDGVEITYDFKDAGISIPVMYELQEDHLSAVVETGDIKEDDTSNETGKILTSLTVMNNFGAADSDDEGYFVIPDGSGALINFNNGKTAAKAYTQTVYGADLTAVPLQEPDVTEQVYFPMYGIVNGDNAMMVVCSEGDSNAKLKASVSGLSKSSYNLCSFEFTLRSTDSYYMSGDNTTTLTVFEEGDIKTETIELRYYPLEDTAEIGMDYIDVANAYRDYLTGEMKVQKADKTDAELYVDIYGGTQKSRSILGIPVTMKTALTTCEQAEAIMQSLIDAGATDLVVSYNKWTNDGIKNKIDADAKASGTIGGKGDFEDLLAYAEDNGVALYPAVQNTGFESGNGYMTFKDTTIRVSGSYAREYTYNLAYGTQQTSKKPLSLITPTAYPEIFSDLADSCSDKGIKNIALSELTSALYGDYGKNLAGRDKAQDLLVESYETLSGSVDSILGNTANAYALPYVDRISNVPLQSSGYDIFDADIPFYQIVLHGLKSYSGTAVNGSADTNETVLRAVAAGSGIRYDMIGEETSILKDTELDNLYYAYYADWTEEAAQSYAFIKDVLAGTGDKLITGYEEEDGVIITTYEDGTVTVVDLEAESVTVNGTEYLLADYVKEGA